MTVAGRLRGQIAVSEANGPAETRGIRHAFVRPDYRLRAEPAEVLEALR